MNIHDSNSPAAVPAAARPGTMQALQDASFAAEDDFLSVLVNMRGVFYGLTDAIDAFVGHRKLLDEADNADELADEDAGRFGSRLLKEAAMLLLIWGEDYPELMEYARAWGIAQRRWLLALEEQRDVAPQALHHNEPTTVQ